MEFERHAAPYCLLRVTSAALSRRSVKLWRRARGKLRPRLRTDAYEGLVETLRDEGVADPSEYGRLTGERQSLDSDLQALNSLSETRSTLHSQLTTLLEEVLTARREVSAARETFLTEALANNRFVRIWALQVWK